MSFNLGYSADNSTNTEYVPTLFNLTGNLNINLDNNMEGFLSIHSNTGNINANRVSLLTPQDIHDANSYGFNVGFGEEIL